MPSGKVKIHWGWYALTGFLAFVGVGASIAHYTRAPYNEGFLEYPNLTAMHVVLGGIFLLLAPFQLLPGIRNRFPAYHRRVGRFLTTLGLIVGITALGLAFITPFSGWWERIVIGIFGTYFLYSIVKGFLAIRKREVPAHRAWMIRAFSIGLSIATMRLIFIPMLIFLGDGTYSTTANFSMTAFTTALVLHAIGAEWYLHVTGKGNHGTARNTRVPKTGIEKKPA